MENLKELILFCNFDKLNKSILIIGGSPYIDRYFDNIFTDRNTAGYHDGVMKGRDWKETSFWTDLVESFNGKKFDFIYVDIGSGSHLGLAIHDFQKIIDQSLKDNGKLIADYHDISSIESVLIGSKKFVALNAFPSLGQITKETIMNNMSKLLIYSKSNITIKAYNTLKEYNDDLNNYKLKHQFSLKDILYKLTRG